MNEKLKKFQSLNLGQLLQEQPQIVPDGVWLRLSPKSELLLTRYQIVQQKDLELQGEALLEPGQQYFLRPSEFFRLHRSDVLDETNQDLGQDLGQAEFFCTPTLYFNKKFNSINGLGQPHSEVAYFKAYYCDLLFCDLLFEERKLQVLDLGCGRGRNAVLFAKEKVLGVDQNAESLAALADMAQSEGCSITTLNADLNSWREAPRHDIAMAIVSLQFIEAAADLLLHCMERALPEALHLAVFPLSSPHPSIVWPSSFYFLPQQQEIKNLYIQNNWSILEYRENFGHLGRAADGLPLRGPFATLIAQKN